jgi:hypothetical protein
VSLATAKQQAQCCTEEPLLPTTDDRPAHRRPSPDCPSWCTECDASDGDASRVHGTPSTALSGHAPGQYGDVGRAEVWAISEDRTPRFAVHIELTEQPVTAAELRATAQALLAFVELTQWSAGQS